jgi:signal transduction histidine kinase
MQPARERLLRAAQQSTTGALTTFIAREANQPLTAIIANANASLRLLQSGAPPEDVREALAEVIEAALSVSEVIGRVRDHFNNDIPQREFLNLDDIVRDALAVVRRDLLRHDVSVRTDLRTGGGRVAGDRLQLQLVVLNLVFSAVDAMSAVIGRPRTITIRSRMENNTRIGVTVTNSGIGPGPEDIDRAFDVFFTTKTDRLGLGLWVSRSIVEAHGGRLSTLSAAFPGSSFHFEVPASRRTTDTLR